VRIGFDGHVLTGKFQGTRTTVGALLRALPPYLGARELVVYTDDPAEARAMLGVEVFHYEGLDHVGSMNRLLRLLPSLFRRDKITLGVFQYMAPLVGRNIVFIHDLLPLSHPHLFPLLMRVRTWIFFTLAIRRATMVLAVSEFTRCELERLYSLGDDQLRLVRNGPSFPADAYRNAPNLGAEKRYVLAVGRIEPRKNVPLLVNAFRQAMLPDDVRLIIVGGHDLNYSYRLPEDSRIEQRTGVSEAQLIELYRSASLFVYPSAAEGFGLPLLDALLFGLPVISSNRTAMMEIGGGLARMFDPEEPGAQSVLAGHIAGHFADCPVQTPNTAERAVLADRFSWDRAAVDFLDAVDEVAKRL
jgi:glycosyltransferase involved in cell wall biosynthesis